MAFSTGSPQVVPSGLPPGRGAGENTAQVPYGLTGKPAPAKPVATVLCGGRKPCWHRASQGVRQRGGAAGLGFDAPCSVWRTGAVLDDDLMETPAPQRAHEARPVAQPEHRPQAEDRPMVSLRTDVPEALLVAMRGFIERHPNWDQYRLIQAALAGFLIQQGWQNRDLTRCYLANLFPSQRRFRGE